MLLFFLWLGLAGMPRRIPDYPEAFYLWNLIASFGSNISALSALLFFYIIYDTLTFKKIDNSESLFAIEKRSK